MAIGTAVLDVASADVHFDALQDDHADDEHEEGVGHCGGVQPQSGGVRFEEGAERATPEQQTTIRIMPIGDA